MKIDDVDWHSNHTRSEVQSGMHIALVYCWLAQRGYLDIEEDQWHDWKKEFRAQKISPAELFLQYSDGKLMTDEIKNPDIAAFLSDWYEQEYLPMLDPGDFTRLDRDSTLPAPYNVANTWENVEKAGGALDQYFKQWQECHPPHILNTLSETAAYNIQ